MLLLTTIVNGKCGLTFFDHQLKKTYFSKTYCIFCEERTWTYIRHTAIQAQGHHADGPTTAKIETDQCINECRTVRVRMVRTEPLIGCVRSTFKNRCVFDPTTSPTNCFMNCCLCRGIGTKLVWVVAWFAINSQMTFVCENSKDRNCILEARTGKKKKNLISAEFVILSKEGRMGREIMCSFKHTQSNDFEG